MRAKLANLADLWYKLVSLSVAPSAELKDRNRKAKVSLRGGSRRGKGERMDKPLATDVAALALGAAMLLGILLGALIALTGAEPLMPIVAVGAAILLAGCVVALFGEIRRAELLEETRGDEEKK